MSDEELIETLREFEDKRVEKLPDGARKLFYAIMKIADERDEYARRLHNIGKYIHYWDIKEIGEKTMLILNDILLIKNGKCDEVVRLKENK